MSTAAAIDTEARTLRIERDFRAPMEKVFEAFTNPAHLSQWWGPEGMTTPDVEMDVREGGAWSTTMVNKEGTRYTVEGNYVTIAPYDRLVFTWGWVEDGVRGHETTVDLSFSRTEGGTRLSLVQQVFEAPEGAQNHNEGWTSSLDCLQQFLSEA